jgi:hypothetical protein
MIAPDLKVEKSKKINGNICNEWHDYLSLHLTAKDASELGVQFIFASKHHHHLSLPLLPLTLYLEIYLSLSFTPKSPNRNIFIIFAWPHINFCANDHGSRHIIYKLS